MRYRNTGYSSGCSSQLSRFTSFICRMSVILQMTFTGLPLRSGCSRSICPTSVNDALCRENGSGRVIHKVEILRSPRSRLLRSSTVPPKTNHLSKYPSISLIATVSVCSRDKWSKYSGVISLSKMRPFGSVSVTFVGVAGIYERRVLSYPASYACWKIHLGMMTEAVVIKISQRNNKTKNLVCRGFVETCSEVDCDEDAVLAFLRASITYTPAPAIAIAVLPTTNQVIKKYAATAAMLPNENAIKPDREIVVWEQGYELFQV